VPVPAGIGQEHPHLRVLDPPGGTDVLALHTDRMHTLFQIAGLIHHQHRVRVAEPLDDHPAQVITDRVGVPARPIQQPLHRIRPNMARPLRQSPARLGLHIGQQPDHKRRRCPTRLNPTEPAREPPEHPGQNPPPRRRVYPVTSGHHII
jgi:hypothetical protein